MSGGGVKSRVSTEDDGPSAPPQPQASASAASAGARLIVKRALGEPVVHDLQLRVAEDRAERHAAPERRPRAELLVQHAGARIAGHHDVGPADRAAGAQGVVAREVEAADLEADGGRAAGRVAVEALQREDRLDVVAEGHVLAGVGVVAHAARAERGADVRADGVEAAGEQQRRQPLRAPPHGVAFIGQLNSRVVVWYASTTAATGAPPTKRSVAARRSALVWSPVVSIDATVAGTVTDTTWHSGDQAASPTAAAKMSFVSVASPSPSMSTWRTSSDNGNPPARVSS